MSCNGKLVLIDIDLEKYEKIVNLPIYTYQKNAMISKELIADLRPIDSSISIEPKVFYDKEIWSFLNVFVFRDIIWKLYFQKNDEVSDITEEQNGSQKIKDKISRYYLNYSSFRSPTRTGFRFLWILGFLTDVENHIERTQAAFEYIDPVKAIFERSISRNRDILNAYIDAILVNRKMRGLKSNKRRSKVPTHINNLAAANLLDAYQYIELVDFLAEQQRLMLID